MNKEEIIEALTFVGFLILGIGMFFCLWTIHTLIN